MKKKHIIIIVAAVAIIISATIFYMFTNNKQTQGGYKMKDTVTFHTLFYPFAIPPTTDSILILNLENYVDGSIAPHENQIFTIKHENINSLYEAMKNIQSNIQINVELVRENYIIIRTNIKDLQYAMIAPTVLTSGTADINTDDNRAFGYMPMQGRFFDQDVFAQNFWQVDGENIATYIPYHLFDNHLLFYLYDIQNSSDVHKNHNLSHRIGHYYKIYGDMADFKAFYESLNLYEITENDGQLILYGLLHKRELGYSSADITLINGKVILNFKEENGQHYVAYSFDIE